METATELSQILQERLDNEAYVEDGNGYTDYAPEIGDALIRESYDLVKTHDNFDLAIYTSDDGDARHYTYSVFLAEAVRRDELKFFQRILEEEEISIYYEMDMILEAVHETKRKEFFLLYLDLLEKDEYSKPEKLLFFGPQEAKGLRFLIALFCEWKDIIVDALFLKEEDGFRHHNLAHSLLLLGAFLEEGLTPQLYQKALVKYDLAKHIKEDV